VDIEGTIRAAARLALAEETGRAALMGREETLNLGELAMKRKSVGSRHSPGAVDWVKAALRHASEIKRLLTGLGVGVLSVELVGRSPDGGGADLRVVFDDDWEPLDEGWGPEDTMAAIFNALESRGYRHVPGTSGFDGGSTAFVKGGLSFNFISSPPPS